MNWGMYGHEWAVHLLKQHILEDRLRHAYLFSGPRGVGKRTLALRLAQAINCPQPTAKAEPCGICSTCRRLGQMIYPDLAVVHAEAEGETLKVDQVRELQRTLALTPYEGHYRVGLLLRFEEAHPSAANALLKTLEEPNPQVVLILTANSTELLLPTIVSRCEVIRLGSIPVELISSVLRREYGIAEDQARLLAHLSNGSPGVAIALYQQPALLSQREIWLEEQRKLLSANRVARFTYAENLGKDKEKSRQVLQTWLSLWRDVLLRCSGASTPLTNIDRESEIDQLASRLDLTAAQQVTTAITRALNQIDMNLNLRLTLEVLLLDLPYCS